jgi:hypothetical protein
MSPVKIFSHDIAVDMAWELNMIGNIGQSLGAEQASCSGPSRRVFAMILGD